MTIDPIGMAHSPIIRESDDRIFQSLKTLSNHHEQPSALLSNARSIGMEPFCKLAKSGLQAVFIHMRSHSENLIEVGRQSTSRLDHVVRQVAEDDKGKGIGIVLTVSGRAWDGRRERRELVGEGLVAKGEQLAGDEVGDDRPAGEAEERRARDHRRCGRLWASVYAAPRHVPLHHRVC
jgi:hypothetical protein